MRLTLVVAFVCIARSAFAAGFFVDQQNAEAAARGGAVAASPTNASTLFYNPAGIATLPGLQVYGSVDAIRPRSKYVLSEPLVVDRPEAQTFYVPSLYASYRINEMWSAGVGIYSPFGLGIRWGADSPARTIVREQVLRTIFITPAVGADLKSIVPGLSAGFGLDVVPASVYLSRDIPFGDSVASAELGGRGVGLGARLGLLWDTPLVRGLRLALAYRSPVKLNFDGEANFSADPTFRSALPPDGPVKTSLTLPQSLIFGVAYDLNRDITLELDTTYIGWSSYDELVLELPDDSKQIAEKAWRNTATLRFGATWDLGPITLRAGYAYDPTPVPRRTLDFTLPDINRHSIAAGIGYALPRGFFVDAALRRILAGERAAGEKAAVAGTYEVSAWVASASIGLSLDPVSGDAARR